MSESGCSSCVVVSSIIALVPAIYLLRKFFEGGQYKRNTRIDGKVVVITGANCGIGKTAAVDLAQRGGKIYIACRDVKRGEAALSDIKSESGSNNVHFLQLDLASMDSIREFATKFHQLESKLHILINNAGVMALPKSLTKDGFELQIGVNHLGHFLLTNLLLDLLKKAAPARIINVSSAAHLFGKINKDDLNSEKSYSKWGAYGQSKLANILFTKELAKRFAKEGITSNSLHPGSVKTELQGKTDVITRTVLEPFRQFFFKTAKSGAQTTIRLAVDPELDNVSGMYFADCKEATTNEAAKDFETAAWLWEASKKMTGLSQ